MVLFSTLKREVLLCFSCVKDLDDSIRTRLVKEIFFANVSLYPVRARIPAKISDPAQDLNPTLPYLGQQSKNYTLFKT
jgi:hypothetical protein